MPRTRVIGALLNILAAYTDGHNVRPVFADAVTALFITPRLANARVADRVIVMREGRIAESGTYRDLLERPDSLFGELHRLQKGRDDA
ncbi:hypothetical protein OG349_02790 [Streptomyces sp. NBC_01317]|uniref:hypothetical protein n=1 Tax=Streptomyces sp. NBC_01317 TaxID=2903822 RepID=UPI002E13B924|nr:hypothetical protein OG349_02790 [Streptomyces sp. NBC_01317]